MKLNYTPGVLFGGLAYYKLMGFVFGWGYLRQTPVAYLPWTGPRAPYIPNNSNLFVVELFLWLQNPAIISITQLSL